MFEDYQYVIAAAVCAVLAALGFIGVIIYAASKL